VIFAALPQSSMLHQRRLLFLLWSMNMNRRAWQDLMRPAGPWVSSPAGVECTRYYGRLGTTAPIGPL
jgi:hypothetical protein